ncbi:phosphoribosyltransferase family protein [Sediminibacterium ginsengisoli]|uniref:Pyrimidine operon attenuation protein / uracil phosphoribosyltransferase n=1 Tax=Sediminibacterium ginsengisoli TaxID=413434 RepID=A0A1T4QVF1_9BACT|nr:phosphoribosyltransferase family protein [Sediminibacterium ginsengisoli]SKA07674.1 pyrimidine operon attenuation protein / uracil phosphoribosyltransferase [Sediminibacterium ginsengisoli]
MADKKYILSKEAAAQKLNRMALELAEHLNGDQVPVVLIGIRNSGMVIAEKTGELLAQYITAPITVISASLDKSSPAEVTLSKTMDFNGLHVVVIDDVTNSGRTLLYALRPLLDAHPKSIQTLVLVERMHKMFPVKPDYVGLSIATTLADHIEVEVENGQVAGAFLM